MTDFREGLSLLPPNMHQGVYDYIKYGKMYEDSGFLYSLFADRFLDVFSSADDTNLTYIREWAKFLYNFAPIGCRGSEDKVKEWTESGGLVGQGRMSEDDPTADDMVGDNEAHLDFGEGSRKDDQE